MAEIFKESLIYQETLCCVLWLAFYSFSLRIGSSLIDKYVVLFCIYTTLFITPYLGHQSSDSRQKEVTERFLVMTKQLLKVTGTEGNHMDKIGLKSLKGGGVTPDLLFI